MSSVGGIRAGRAYVELYADLTKLQQSLKLAESKLKAFGDSAASIGGQFLGVGVAASTPIALAVKNYADFDDQMRATQAVSVAHQLIAAVDAEVCKQICRMNGNKHAYYILSIAVLLQL